MNLPSIKRGKKSKLHIRGFSFLILAIIFWFGSISDIGDISSIFAQTKTGEGSSVKKDMPEDNKNNDNRDITTIITVNLNKNSIADIKNNNNLLKIVGYLNGEGKTKYIDLKEIDKEKGINQNQKFLKVDLKFNKSNDISSTMVDDEYYVCAYVMKENNTPENAADTFPLYDCDEGNIGTSTTKDTVTLFSTMKKYGESKAFFTTTNQNTGLNTTKDNPIKNLKITINVPVSDAKDIDDMNVVAMVKGEYQIKTIDVQKELKSGNNKENNIILVPFIFKSQTEVGPIQPGDLFFGCATSDEFPNQNSDCEKRMLKSLDNSNKICARKDNLC